MVARRNSGTREIKKSIGEMSYTFECDYNSEGEMCFQTLIN